jgi:hypothetical protein
VAVLVPGPAGSIFKQYYPQRDDILRVMIFTIFQHSLSNYLFLFKPKFLKPDMVVTGMWLCRFRFRQVAILINIIHTVFLKL